LSLISVVNTQMWMYSSCEQINFRHSTCLWNVLNNICIWRSQFMLRDKTGDQLWFTYTMEHQLAKKFLTFLSYNERQERHTDLWLDTWR
jgi:hypothetical protein